jgi:outer membrane protein TolC
MTTAAPAVAVRSQEVNAATRQAESARQELRPTWSVGGGFYWQGGFDRTVSLTVGVELPLRKARKQLPLIAAAEQEAHAAQLDVQDAAAEVRAEARRLVAAWQAAGEQIERYRTAVLPQNSAAFDATRSSYLAGRGDFASILEEFRRWIEVRIDLGSREAQRYAARARLDGLLGRVGQVGQ